MNAPIFLSYDDQDKDLMERLRDDLTKAGFTVWTDQKIPLDHPTRRAEIEQLIGQSGCFIVIYSPESADSPQVREEIKIAEAHHLQAFTVFTQSARSTTFIQHLWRNLRDETQYQEYLPYLLADIKEFLI